MADDPRLHPFAHDGADPAPGRAPAPFHFEVEDEADPASAPPLPEDELRPTPPAIAAMAVLTRSRGSRLTKLALWVFGALFTFVLAVAAWDFVTGLLASNPVLGGIAFVLVVAAVIMALALAGREAMGFVRLGRLDHIRLAADEALLRADLQGARKVEAELRMLYRGRSELSWGLRRLSEAGPEIIDADALLALSERELLGPLDARARAEIELAARRVATVTAIVPVALADVAAALWSNMAMIRKVAAIYGGRTGALGSWKLFRKVFTSLLATGAVALADDLVSSVAGGGVLSKLSRRFGEGVVNGALTARIGIAAMEACRPLPFRVAERPSVSGLLTRALAGLMPRGAQASAGDDPAR